MIPIGQGFSTTIPTGTSNPGYFNVIPDVKHNGYVFSDGVGKISRSKAIEVSRQLNLKYVPSAFQIRFGGGKGIV